jgi:hypothetical protein
VFQSLQMIGKIFFKATILINMTFELLDEPGALQANTFEKLRDGNEGEV